MKTECYQCGRVIERPENFCPYCGGKLGFNEEFFIDIKNGSQKALAYLYRETYADVYLTIHTLIKDEELTFRLIQNSYETAFSSLNTLKSSDEFHMWIKKIALNESRDKINTQLFSSETEEKTEINVEFPEEKIGGCPEAFLTEEAAKRFLWEILDGLPEKQRIVVSLFYFQEFSIQKIAEFLECSESDVKDTLICGRKVIQEYVPESKKKGADLFGLSPIVFFLSLLKGDEIRETIVPDRKILSAVLRKKKSAGMKGIICGAVAITVIGTSVLAANHMLHKQELKGKQGQEKKIETSSEDTVPYKEEGEEEVKEEKFTDEMASQYYSNILLEYQQAEVHGEKDLYYVILDMAGDQMPELFVSEKQEGDKEEIYKIVDMYAYSNGGGRHLSQYRGFGKNLLDGYATIGEQTQYTICKGGIIKEDTISATGKCVQFYKMEANTAMTFLLEGFLCEGDQYHYVQELDVTPYTQQESEDMLEKYEEEEIAWKKLSLLEIKKSFDPMDKLAHYKEVIQEYQRAVAEGFQGEYTYVTQSFLRDFYVGGPIYYTLYDFCGDQMPELLLSYGDEKEIVGLYGCEDGFPKDMNTEVPGGFGFQVCQNNIIRIQWNSGGMSTGSTSFYRIKPNSCVLEKVDGVSHDGYGICYDNRSTDQMDSENEITREYYELILETYQKDEQVLFSWNELGNCDF